MTSSESGLFLIKNRKPIFRSRRKEVSHMSSEDSLLKMEGKRKPIIGWRQQEAGPTVTRRRQIRSRGALTILLHYLSFTIITTS